MLRLTTNDELLFSTASLYRFFKHATGLVVVGMDRDVYAPIRVQFRPCCRPCQCSACRTRTDSIPIVQSRVQECQRSEMEEMKWDHI